MQKFSKVAPKLREEPGILFPSTFSIGQVEYLALPDTSGIFYNAVALMRTRKRKEKKVPYYL